MHPRLFQLPIYLVAMAGIGILGLIMFSGVKRAWLGLAAAAGIGVAAACVAYLCWGDAQMPVHSYGVSILVGFLFGVWMAARRSELMGVAKFHCMDIGTYGAILGIVGARLLNIALSWPDYPPLFGEGNGIAGLDFFGAFATSIVFTYFYCRHHKIPAIPFIDLAVPSLIAGQAFGRIGCFLYGCCYGKPTNLPWQVCFPPDSPAFYRHVDDGLIAKTAICSAGIHPTQIYASIASALTAGFLYAYWPRRPYDGSVLALMLIMFGAMRFFEELLRADEPPLFAAIPTLTAAHYFALAAMATGAILMLYFRRNPKLYKPVPSAA